LPCASDGEADCVRWPVEFAQFSEVSEVCVVEDGGLGYRVNSVRKGFKAPRNDALL
jgi:hypothetical protein